MHDTRNNVSKRWLLFGVWVAVSSLLFAKPLLALLLALVHLSLTNDDASHLIVIPFLTAGLVFMERRTIFKHPSFSAGGGWCVPGRSARKRSRTMV